MTDNPYDQFDTPDGSAPPQASQQAQPANPYDQFDQKRMVGSVCRLAAMLMGQSTGSTQTREIVGGVKHAIQGLPALAHQVGSETAQNTATPATAGSVAGDAMMAMPAGELKVPTADVAVPTSQELYAAANQGYDSLRNLGVHYDLNHVSSMAQGAQDALGNLGLSSEVAPKTHAILNKLGDPPDGAVSVPLTGLTNVRSVLGRIGQQPDPVERLAAKKATSALDDFVQNPPPEAVLAGDAAQAASTLRVANGNYAAAKRSDKINGAGEYAQFRADSANSGANFDNSLRQQVRPLIDPRYPQRLNGFNDSEKDAITGIVEGSPVRNGLRVAGNVLGGGGGMHSYISGITGAGAGYEAAGMPGALVGGATPLVGAAAKYGQNQMGRSALENADELIRSRSPLFQQRQAAAQPQVPINSPHVGAAKAIDADNQPESSQPAYAKGGPVKKPTHEFLVQRLMKLAERAKKQEKQATKPILNLPDDTVTMALRKAQAAI